MYCFKTCFKTFRHVRSVFKTCFKTNGEILLYQNVCFDTTESGPHYSKPTTHPHLTQPPPQVQKHNHKPMHAEPENQNPGHDALGECCKLAPDEAPPEISVEVAEMVRGLAKTGNIQVKLLEMLDHEFADASAAADFEIMAKQDEQDLHEREVLNHEARILHQASSAASSGPGLTVKQHDDCVDDVAEMNAASNVDLEEEIALGHMLLGDFGAPNNPLPGNADPHSAIFKIWARAAQKGEQTVKKWHQQREHALGQELSLVEVGWPDFPRTTYVNWDNIERRTGREHKLDEHNRIKWVIPGFSLVQHFRACVVVHAAIGVRVRQAKGEGRPTVPEHVRRLKLMWEATIDRATTGSCISCKGDNGEDVLTCACCLCDWHDSCSARLSKIASGRLSLLAGPARPVEWHGGLCHMCIAWGHIKTVSRTHLFNA